MFPTNRPLPPRTVKRPTTTPARLGASYHKLFWATVSNLGDGMSTIAYPWLASAVTRNPLLIALVLVAQRCPGSCSRCPPA